MTLWPSARGSTLMNVSNILLCGNRHGLCVAMKTRCSKRFSVTSRTIFFSAAIDLGSVSRWKHEVSNVSLWHHEQSPSLRLDGTILRATGAFGANSGKKPMSVTLLMLSSERSRHDCAIAKNSNADRISAGLLHCLSTNWYSVVFWWHSLQLRTGDFSHKFLPNRVLSWASRNTFFGFRLRKTMFLSCKDSKARSNELMKNCDCAREKGGRNCPNRCEQLTSCDQPSQDVHFLGVFECIHQLNDRKGEHWIWNCKLKE